MTNATNHVTNAVTRVSEMSQIPRRLSTFLIGVKEKCSNQTLYHSMEHKVSLFLLTVVTKILPR